MISLAKKLGIRFALIRMTPRLLCQADEVFLTNSLIGIMPLTSLEGRCIGAGRRGKITARLSQAYQALNKR